MPFNTETLYWVLSLVMMLCIVNGAYQIGKNKVILRQIEAMRDETERVNQEALRRLSELHMLSDWYQSQRNTETQEVEVQES